MAENPLKNLSGCYSRTADERKGKHCFFQKLIIITEIGFIFIHISMTITMSLVPPFMRDELTHHLAVPKLWIQNGGILEIPEMLASYYPMNLDLLYAVPLYFGNDIIPKIIHNFFGLGTAWLIFRFLREKLNTAFSLLGVLMFLTIPIIVKLSTSAYVDLGLVFFSWASLYFLFEWIKQPNKIRSLIFSAVCCGLGIGTKYNGLIVLFIIALFIPAVYLSNVKKSLYNQIQGILKSIIFLGVALTIFSPWMVKNYFWVGNPIYPLYQNKITGDKDPLRFSMAPALQRKLVYNENLLDILSVPMRIFYQGQDDNPKRFDGKLNPVFLLLIFLPFVLKPTDIHIRRNNLILALFSLVYFLFVFFTVDMRIRYIVPILAPITILSVFGLHSLFIISKRLKNRSKIYLYHFIFLLTVISYFGINIVYITRLYKEIDPLSYLSGKLTKEEYLEKRLPELPVISHLNNLAFNDAKILAIFIGGKRYYFEKDVVFMLQNFRLEAEDQSSKNSLREWLIENSYSHLCIATIPFKNWVNHSFNQYGKKRINDLFQTGLEFVYYKNGFSIYKIKEQSHG